MTSIDNTLALYLVHENFGEVAKSVAALLIKKTLYPFFLIVEDLGLEKRRVSQILSILITHHLVEYKLNQKQIVEYSFNTTNAIERLKTPRSINLIRNFSGNDKFSESIINEFYMHGSLEMSSVLLKLLARIFNEPDMKPKSTDLNQIYAVYNTLVGTFTKLIEDNFIERLPQLIEDASNDDMKKEKMPKPKIPNFMKGPSHEATKHFLPSLSIEAQRMQKSVLEDLEVPSCRIRKPDENFGDKEIYWKVNQKRVLQCFRDESLIEALENRIDKNAGNILRVIFQLADDRILDRAEQNSFQSKPVTAIDIQRLMRSKYQMDSQIVDKYLNVMLQDTFKVLEKIGDFSGGAYCVDFKKSLTNLCLAHIESYIRERYESKSLRIFRVILEKSKLEQKQIEDFSMVPSKECKALVYNMLNDGLLSIIELSKTSDHAPSRTYYLFYVDIFLITKKLLENSYKSIKNLIIKREQLTSENKRLLKKDEKIKQRIESLIAQGAEQSEIDYEKSIMSQEELSQLSSFTTHCNKIEMAEIQLEETIFIFENYFYYHTAAPVVQPPKRR